MFRVFGLVGGRLIIGVVIVAALGVGGFFFRDFVSGSVVDLKVGDCFDVPDGASTFSSLRRTSCDTPHSGEVFHVFDATTTAGATYPSDPDWGALIYPVCDPQFDAWTGTSIETSTVVRYRFLVPSKDEFDRGGRRVTCFLSRTDGQKLDTPLHVTPRPSS